MAKSKTAKTAKNVYPTEVLERAEYEMHIFERVGAETAEMLLEEIKRLRQELADALRRADEAAADLEQRFPLATRRTW